VIDPPLPGVSVADVDDDGTVLLNTSGAGACLWKNGTGRQLTDPAGFGHPYVRAISNGRVVGAADGLTSSGQGFLWVSPDDPQTIKGAVSASEINSHELVAGQLKPFNQAPGAWFGVAPAGALPIPTGHKTAYVPAVGGGDSVTGQAGDVDPVVWRCFSIGPIG
jgi:hypothetical protein